MSLPPCAEPQLLHALLSADEADPDQRDWLQQTPLHIAAFGGNPAIVRLLLDAGSDPSAVDQARTSADPADPARSRQGRGAARRCRLAAAAYADSPGTQAGHTPLHRAALKAHTEASAACAHGC